MKINEKQETENFEKNESISNEFRSQNRELNLREIKRNNLIIILLYQNQKELIEKNKRLGDRKYKNTQTKNKVKDFNRKLKKREEKEKRDMFRSNNFMEMFQIINYKNLIRRRDNLLMKKEMPIIKQKDFNLNVIQEIK